MRFLAEFSEQVVEEFEKHKLDHKVVVLPCGHYRMGETPYKYVDGRQLASFCGRRLSSRSLVIARVAVGIFSEFFKENGKARESCPCRAQPLSFPNLGL